MLRIPILNWPWTFLLGLRSLRVFQIAFFPEITFLAASTLQLVEVRGRLALLLTFVPGSRPDLFASDAARGVPRTCGRPRWLLIITLVFIVAHILFFLVMAYFCSARFTIQSPAE